VRLTQKLARVYIAAAVAALSLAGPAAAQTVDAVVRSTAVDVSKIRIDNFGQINSHYFRGAQPKGHDYADLAALGIKTLINLTSDDADATESAMAGKSGLAYFQIPMTTHEQPTAAKLAEFLKLVNDPARQPVYVHCVGGRHRTGVMTAAYRMTQDAWTADRAFQEMKQYKFGADFLHPEFKEFVYGYHPEVVRVAASPASAAAPATSASAAASKSGG
jgi:protein tyrosine/serine phosphatase